MREGLYFGIALVMTVLVIPLLKRVSSNIGYVDRPDGDALKVHSGTIPHSGGIAVFGVLFLLVIFWFLSGQSGLTGIEVIGLLLGGSIAFGLGVWDDLKPSHPFVRLSIQILAGVVLVAAGHKVDGPLFVGFPLTVFYVVGSINAINLEDGLDGLAGGLALISCLGFALLCTITGHAPEFMVSFILSGILIGFLIFNFNPSSIFMGDSGSYFVGLILAYLAVGFTDLNHWSTFVAPVLIIGVPVLDTAYAILRRIKKGISPFYGDRSHFYDQLMQKGLSVRQTVLICWGIQSVLVGVGVAIYS